MKNFKQMAKLSFLTVVISMLLALPVMAMNQTDLNNTRNEYQQIINSAPVVSWDDLNNNPSGYKGTMTTFTALYTGGDKSAEFKATDGSIYAVAYPLPYRFKVGTEYTVSATFLRMVTAGDETAAVFTYEAAHLPIMSEYGL